MHTLSDKNIYNHFQKYTKVMFLSSLHFENSTSAEVAYVNLT